MSKCDINEEHIRVAAYYIWEKEGRPDGVDFEHWVKAKNCAAAADKKAATSAASCKKSCASKDKAATKTKAKAKTSTKAKSKKK